MPWGSGWRLQAATEAAESRVAVLEAEMATEALQARVAALEAESATTDAEAARSQTSTAARVPAKALFADATLATPERFAGWGHRPGVREWVFHMENYMFYVGVPEDQRVRYAQQFLTSRASCWWAKVCRERATWTWKEFASKLKRKYA